MRAVRRIRIRLSLLILLIITFTILYLATARRTTRSSPFYAKTQSLLIKARYDKDVTNAMANAGDPEAAKKVQNRSPTGKDRIHDALVQQEVGQGRLEDTLKERLRLAEVAAKQNAHDKLRGIVRAAEKASTADEKERVQTDAAKDKDTHKEALSGDDLVGGKDTKHDDTSQREAADAVVKIIDEVKRSVTEEVHHENAGEGPEAAKEAEKSKEKVEALISEVSKDKAAAAELRNEILAAREREKADLKAELRQQLRKREMDRQRAAGKKLKAVDPAFQERQRLQKLGSKAAKDKEARRKAAATSKAPPIPTTPAEVEFHKLLALSPVMIFSKSYCPHSLKAKRILTQAFDITPSPYVVELDRHDMGEEIQAILLAKTQRRTVPNVIIAGKSIGGGSEVEQLWESGKLRQTIKQLAGRRVVGVVENEDILKKGWRS